MVTPRGHFISDECGPLTILARGTSETAPMKPKRRRLSRSGVNSHYQAA